MTVRRGTAPMLVWLVAIAIALQSEAASQTSNAEPATPAPATAQEGDPLEKLLHTMDQTAAAFHSAQADFVWTTYNSVINDTAEKDTGKIYFRRSGKNTEMSADVAAPAAKQIVFSDGKIQVFMPETRQLDVYDAGTHRDEFETFLVLGFGSSGADMRKSFSIKYLGQEQIGKAETAKLELTPLSPKVSGQFPKIDLWIDTQRGMSLRQQLWETGGDYRLADYSNIQVNRKVADSAFKLRTPGGTKVVTH
jgi:outer membrane lipoprotein-sorting protein